MRNHVRNLYKELSTYNKEMNDSKKELKREFNSASINKMYTCWYKESDFTKEKAEEHSKKKSEWLIQRIKKETKEALPSKIDNIVMDDCELPVNFQSEPRVYGGVKLTSEESELLKLPPKFAVYKKSDELTLKAQFEKAVTCLR